MSANNYILVKELKNGRFKVVELDADTNSQIGKAAKAGSLREAIKTAQGIQSEDIVEYGISFELLD